MNSSESSSCQHLGSASALDIRKIAAIKSPFVQSVSVPGSKSYTNRALLLASLTRGPVELLHPLYSGDTEAMINCLKVLGIEIEKEPDRIVVHGDLFSIRDQCYELNVQDSGTSMRFLLAALCLTKGCKIIGGTKRLNERPIQALVDALCKLGAWIKYLGPLSTAPLQIESKTLICSKEVLLDASISSQFLSALLMIAPFLNGTEISLQGPLISSAYVDMTMQMMQEWGGEVTRTNGRYVVKSLQCYQMQRYAIEGDFSSASYFFAIAALSGSAITVCNLNPKSLQADASFLKILEQMGNQVIWGKHEVTVRGRGIQAALLDMEICPDQVQTMAVLAAFAHGKTVLSGVRSLRVKETERVIALKNELAKMGIQTEDTYDTLTIYGGNPCPATIETYDDHRMAMAFAVAGTKLEGMRICRPEVVNKTFPTFWDVLERL